MVAGAAENMFIRWVGGTIKKGGGVTVDTSPG
jgi:hypothetical protein